MSKFIVILAFCFLQSSNQSDTIKNVVKIKTIDTIELMNDLDKINNNFDSIFFKLKQIDSLYTHLKIKENE